MTKIRNRFALSLALSGLVLLPACGDAGSDVETDGATHSNGSQTMAATLGAASDLSTVNQAFVSSDLMGVFDGVGSYTLLAPRDEAFEALGEAGEQLMTEEQRPLLVGLLRDHMLPGYLRPEDILSAIESQGGEVTVTTMGGGDVVFSSEGDTLTVTRDDGTSATFVGNAEAATNGVIIPIDGVLAPQ
ncbi:fasciclin domain-containing protein [Qipengyuania aquimaris]|uniref:fasciclin domain-containing protein n=1 Tax=Qipengyuania aquimaris TaxID=255984 RepID=UPI001CD5871B|nr:fasciclin domain-containing protein [Qipengyuania aquimaris]MCA0902797.1 fasciclin domain-containing protein [Qipengyuania aquimaris]